MRWRSVMILGTMGLVLACAAEPESTNGGGGAAGASSGGSSSGSGGAATGDGPGLHATGSLMGEPVEIQCEPPSDVMIGKQFLHQTPAGLHQWSIRCRTEDQEVQIWIDLINPETGTTYEQPDAADQMNVALGSPSDIQPLNWVAGNLTEMMVTIDEADNDAEVLVGSFKASWSDEGDKYGSVEGTFDIREW